GGGPAACCWAGGCCGACAGCWAGCLGAAAGVFGFGSGLGLVAGACAGACACCCWACTAGAASIASAATGGTSDQPTAPAGADTNRIVILNPLSRRFRLQVRRSGHPLEWLSQRQMRQQSDTIGRPKGPTCSPRRRLIRNDGDNFKAARAAGSGAIAPCVPVL